MIKTAFLRAAPLVLALAAFGANAQSANPTGPGNVSPNKAGEAYPNGPTTSRADTSKTGGKVADTVVKTEDKVANSRPAQATKRGVKRASNAVKRAGTKTASAIRNTGNKINSKVPPGPEDGKK